MKHYGTVKVFNQEKGHDGVGLGWFFDLRFGVMVRPGYHKSQGFLLFLYKDLKKQPYRSTFLWYKGLGSLDLGDFVMTNAKMTNFLAPPQNRS